MKLKRIPAFLLCLVFLLGLLPASAMAEGEVTRYVVPCQNGHSYELIETVAPTCTEQGYKYYECSVCWDHYEDDYVAPLGHNYVDGVCTRCGAADPCANGHDYVAVKTVEPTCTERGYTRYKCSVCGRDTVADFVDATGHDYDIERVAGNCENPGYEIRTCKKCGATSYSILNYGHMFSDGVRVVSGNSYKLPANGFTVPGGWRFIGWRVDEGETVYAAGTWLENVTEEHMLTAVWEVQVSFDKGNSEASGSMSAVWVAKDSAYTLPSCAFQFTQSGVQMVCMGCRIDGDNNLHAVGSTITVTGPTTLIAHWYRSA